MLFHGASHGVSHVKEDQNLIIWPLSCIPKLMMLEIKNLGGK